MDIQARGRGLPLPNMLHDYSVARTTMALDRFQERIERVELVFTDLNGPRNAPAEACRIFVHLTGAPVVVVEARDNGFYAALARAVAKARHAVAQLLRRRRRKVDRRAPAFIAMERRQP
jgi:ribosome-associated translation inhibitor RaiA